MSITVDGLMVGIVVVAENTWRFANMEELKVRHTPGPWRVELLEHEDTSENLIQCNGTRCIASVDNSDDEDRANAALITAAPELKEMLSLAVCYVDNVEVKNQIYRLLGKIDGVGDTFAKAEGRS